MPSAPNQLILDPSHIVTGAVSGETSATQLAALPCRMILFKAEAANAGNVYIGTTSGVTKISDSTTDATTGLQLDAGEMTPWIPCVNKSQFWIICDNAGDDLTYMALT